MTGRREAPPFGSAARDATASPYVGKRRAPDNFATHWMTHATTGTPGCPWCFWELITEADLPPDERKRA